MNCDFRGIVAAVFLMPMVWGQNPADVSFTLATKGGKTSFRIGEAVEVEFRFNSSTPGRYWIENGRAAFRYSRHAEYDNFLIDPSDGVIDPLAESFFQRGDLPVVGPGPQQMAGNPVVLGLQVSQWFSIRKPGHYRITADTSRVSTRATGSTTAAGPFPALTPVPLRSNTIEIDVVAPEPGWDESRLDQAVATLAGADRLPRSLQNDPVPEAARMLRFLETPAAAQALVRFASKDLPYAQAELLAGLIGSPYRKEIIAAMEEALVAPDIEVTPPYIGALTDLVKLTRFGPMPPDTAKTVEEMRRFYLDVSGPYQDRAKPIGSEYFAKLADALPRKRGQALAVSLNTLALAGPQPPPAGVSKALTENFLLLPEDSQQNFLTRDWYRIGAPTLEPLILSLAGGSGPLRDSALIRLQELNPAAARKVALDRIRKGDILGSLDRYRNNSALLTMPDKTLPDLDEALAQALEAGKRVDVLVARYASDGIRERLQSWVKKQNLTRLCGGELVAYFFRVDEAWASTALAEARQSNRGQCSINLAPNEDVLMSPGLERQAIVDLTNPAILIRRSAVTLLQRGGSAAMEAPLLDTFLRLRETGANLADVPNLEQAFVGGLMGAGAWVPSAAMMDRMVAACSTDECHRQITASAKEYQSPVAIGLMPGNSGMSFARIGLVLLRTRQQFEKKIAQFPEGTEFFLEQGGEGSWYRDQRSGAIQEILDTARMRLVDRPAPIR
jgi:hypothetical protein